jgi:hypothetical protein
MKLAVMQPYIFPYLGYFQLINLADKFVIYDDVNFIKGGWINRNKILINNEAGFFTIPLKQSSPNKLIREIEISMRLNWKKKYLKTIDQNYRKAPHFNEVFELISGIIEQSEVNISKFIYFSLMRITEYLGIKTEIIESSTIYSNSDIERQNRLIDICKKENAEKYINPIGGKELYSKEYFNSHGIKLIFIKQKRIEYKQFENDFIDSLSIIDIMMFNSKNKIREYLKEFELS